MIEITRKLKLILAGLLVAGVIIWGFIGYCVYYIIERILR